ncbi:hypothetical protein [Clostridium sp. OS1-26]|uniref:hypothetical protein n=1 Tax=Clostridium sp. OS1-26 TaxID=3070681 RepID=UPI0027E0B150|nr:hypothetical protein [Clostridium sp. OS1-26]WML36747.1 hypothetical protein RCG18_09030 [Clostridium sp. OS1-26]
MKCFLGFEGDSAYFLFRYIKKSINYQSISLLKKYSKYSYINAAVDLNDNLLNAENTKAKCNVQNILSMLTLEAYYSTYGYKKITEYDIEILKEFIEVGDLRVFACNKGIKYKSAMKTLNRTLYKIKEIANSLGIATLKDSYLLY